MLNLLDICSWITVATTDVLLIFISVFNLFQITAYGKVTFVDFQTSISTWRRPEVNKTAFSSLEHTPGLVTAVVAPNPDSNPLKQRARPWAANAVTCCLCRCVPRCQARRLSLTQTLVLCWPRRAPCWYTLDSACLNASCKSLGTRAEQVAEAVLSPLTDPGT